jgi:glycosyltransferase involved in cell wall biosynthesis
MERAVLELFEALRPEVEPHFVTAESFKRAQLPVIDEIERLNFQHSFLPDGNGGWPAWGRRKSAKHLWNLAWTTLLGNAFTLHKGWNCDAIYLPSPRYTAGWTTAAWMKARGKAVIYHSHDLRPSRTMLRPWYPLITDIVFSTETSRLETTQHAPRLGRVRSSVIPYVISIRDGMASVQGQGPPRIVYLGQVSRHKGIELLIAAFSRASLSHPYSELHLVGGAPPDFADDLVHLISESRASDRIHFWGFRSDARDFLQSAAIYVQPSPPSRFGESFGRSVVEAMALGIPVVCFPSGALAEIVQDGKSGYVCQEETADCLAGAMSKLLRDPAERVRLGEGARARYEAEFAPSKVRQRWVHFFRRVVNKA